MRATHRCSIRVALWALATLAVPVSSASALPMPTRGTPALAAPPAVQKPEQPRLRLLDLPVRSAPVLVADASTALGRPDRPPRRGGLIAALTRRPKEIDARAAAALIRPGDRVFVPVGQVSSNHILGALADRAKAQDGGLSAEKPVEIVSLTNVLSPSVYDREGKVVPRALFLSANMRDPVAAGRGSFTPAYFGRIPRLIREGKVPVDVAVVQVSPPDRLGFVTLGPTAGCSRAALDKARLVIAQVNKELPRTFGDTRIHISKLDYVVKKDEPLVPIPRSEITETDRQIARNVVDLVLKQPEGAKKAGLFRRALKKLQNAVGCGDLPSFQFGIGGIPDAVAQELASSKELSACRIRTELVGPGTQHLVSSGKVKGKVIYTFAQGDQPFLRWLDGNRKLKARTVDFVNDPARIGKQRQTVAINSALRVDLTGQVNAQYIKGQWYSGVGGQVDFMRGAMTSKNGKAIIALPSVAEVSDGQGGRKLVSKIVPRLGEDDVVTTNMHDVQFVVTEHGVAALEGKTDLERARALIAIAHPQFRAELTAALEAQLAARKRAEQARWEKMQATGARPAAH